MIAFQIADFQLFKIKHIGIVALLFLLLQLSRKIVFLANISWIKFGNELFIDSC